MAVLAIPLIEGAGALLAEAFPALLGGTATAGILSLSGDQAQDRSKTQPVARTMPKTDEACKKCPPDAGNLVTRNWNMSDTSRTYQAQVTGFAPNTEWNFSGLDFDGFRASLCQLEEAKANYDQFLIRRRVSRNSFQSFRGPKNSRPGVYPERYRGWQSTRPASLVFHAAIELPVFHASVHAHRSTYSN